jgi:alpha-L-rhamnosidase
VNEHLRVAPALDWTAEMIRPLADQGVGHPATFVAKTFQLASLTGTETLYISALGLYRAFLNGRRIGNDLLTPGWTNYDQRLSYQTYPVADLLVPGENRLEIWLGDGWLRSQMMWGKNPILNTWGEHVAAIAELRSGPAGAPLLLTDATWDSGELPIRKSGIYFGEIVDARLTPQVTAGTEALAFDKATLLAHEITPVRELPALVPAKSWVDDANRTIYDFGQNAAGNVLIRVSGPAGSRVIVEHGEVLDEKGQFYNGNYRSAAARLEYTLSGQGEETYTPTFTFQGYRYARVTLEGGAQFLGIVSVPISSVTEVKASFTSANPLVDRLFLNTLWSQRSNFIEIPTDCPQRDERLGWTGDAQVFAGTACYLADAGDFFRKWLRDLMVDQRPDGAIPHVCPDPTRMQPEKYPGFFGSTGWGDAIYLVPWQLYLHYGDTDILAEVLPAMIKWVDFVWSISDGPVVSPPRAWGARGFSFGDWLQPSGPSAKPLPTISDETAATAYLYIAASRVARIAAMVGDEATSTRLAAMADKVRAAFAREFITPSGRVGGDDQTSYALAFAHDLIPADRIEDAKKHFRNAIARTDGRIGTGFIGTPELLPALIKIGERELATRLFLQEGLPGWLYQVKMGATTIWERWDAISPDGTIYNPQMNSYNHYAYGAVCQWLLEGVAGFRPDPEAPGFRKVIFEPLVIRELSPVAAHHDSPRGRIAASWRIDGDTVHYDFEVPESATGRLVLPAGASSLTLDGQPTSQQTINDIGPGPHTAIFTYPAPTVTVPQGPGANARTP